MSQLKSTFGQAVAAAIQISRRHRLAPDSILLFNLAKNSAGDRSFCLYLDRLGVILVSVSAADQFSVGADDGSLPDWLRQVTCQFEEVLTATPEPIPTVLATILDVLTENGNEIGGTVSVSYAAGKSCAVQCFGTGVRVSALWAPERSEMWWLAAEGMHSVGTATQASLNPLEIAQQVRDIRAYAHRSAAQQARFFRG